MNPRTRQIIYSLAVLTWSAVLLYFHASGRITKYLATDFRPVALAGGLGLAVLGLFNLLTAGQEAACGHDHGGEQDPHHPDRSYWSSLTAFLLMVLPVAAAVAWTTDSYSIAALARKGLYDAPAGIASPLLALSMGALTPENIEKGSRKTADGFHQLDLIELYFATGDRELQTLIDGLKVETKGRLIDEKTGNPHGTRKRLYRLFITCCAADSRVIPIILEFGSPPPEFPDNAWVRVAGTLRFQLEGGVLQAVLTAERVLATEPPSEESFMR